jgi:DNA repair protein RecN (Recombination protein N)
MLTSLTIRDFVIVEHAELEFASGFSVLTGETGAGKSILIDALSLVLGERGDAQSVRPGCKQAEVSAEFAIPAKNGVQAWLGRNAFEGDSGICLLRRIVDAGGRSRAFINGHPAPVVQLREIGELLVDIHGQHAHQSLLRAQTQRALLDAYAGAEDLAGQVSAAHRVWNDLRARHASAISDARALQAERETLAWKANELARLAFEPEAWQELLVEHGRLTHAASLIDVASECIDALGEGELNAAGLIASAMMRLERACEHDPGLRAMLDALESAQIQVSEAATALERYRSKLDIDPRRLGEIDRRIQAVHDLCRKLRLSPDDLPATLSATQARLAELEHDLDLSRLERELQAAERAYREHAAALSQARRTAATKLGSEVTQAMQDLALSGGVFRVALETLEAPASSGLERVDFRVGTHAGAEPGSLSRVASGGELSRISLAIQSVLSQIAQVPTLIFDEVDAGIGGRVAEIVGTMLRRLGARHQVMCVTHLPQVAACAQHHWRVAKSTQNGNVSSEVELLAAPRRVEEIARMLGGIKMTRATQDHAAEMLRNASRRR